MKLARGDMWDAFADADLFCVTTNSTLKADGSLVMGAGIAKQVAERFSDFPTEAGLLIGGISLGWGVKDYLLAIPFDGEAEKPAHKIACLQVKRHFKEKADLELIRKSLHELVCYVDIENLQNVHLNFPGIGFGGLRREDVLPLLEALPDCVTVWEYEE